MDNNSKESPEKKRRKSAGNLGSDDMSIDYPTGASSSNQPSAGNPRVANMNIDYQASTGSNQPSASSSNQPSAGDPTYTNGNPFLTPRGPKKTIQQQYEEAERRYGVGWSRPAIQDREEYYATTQPSTTVRAPYVPGCQDFFDRCRDRG